jgi:hypothetical protein
MLSLLVDVAFATKHPEERDVQLLPIEQLIRGLAKKLLWKEAVGCIACGVDCLGSQFLGCVVLI